MATYIINRKPQVRAYYKGGDLPYVKIMQGIRTLFEGRGSSVGPRNPAASPDASDIAYWRSLAGLSADAAEVEACTQAMASHSLPLVETIEADTTEQCLNDAERPTAGDYADEVNNHEIS